MKYKIGQNVITRVTGTKAKITKIYNNAYYLSNDSGYWHQDDLEAVKRGRPKKIFDKGTRILTNTEVVDKKVLDYLERAEILLDKRVNYDPIAPAAMLSVESSIEIAKMIQLEEKELWKNNQTILKVNTSMKH